MSASKKITQFPPAPQVVGTIHSPGALRRALRLREGQVDFLEMRVDHFADDPETLLRAASRLCAPLIVTVRHPREGGANQLSLQRRKELIAQFLPVASVLDIELRSVELLKAEADAAQSAGVKLIVSDHHFKSTPTDAALRSRLRQASQAGADIFKIATLTSGPAELARLLGLFARKGKGPMLSAMGMGEFGKVSRLLLAKAGSVLNYGYLDTPQVPGQWEAVTLKQRVQEIASETDAR